MSKKIAIIVSGLSSPFIVLPIVGLIAISHFSPNLSEFVKWSVLYLVLPILPPALYILLQVKRGKISDVHVAVREQRAVPFFLAGLGAAVLLGLYLFLKAPSGVVVLAIAMLLCAIMFGLITQIWKISIHAASWVGGVTLLAMLVSVNYLWFLLFLPFVVWGRLARGRHNIYQILVAVVIVSVGVFVAVRLFLGSF